MPPPEILDVALAPRLLLVEDDALLRRMLSELFESEGYAVDAAADGQRGMHYALTRSYDVQVFDRGLPAIEGLDLISRLRSKGINTPTLILSALDGPRERVLGLDAGAEDYVGKPFDIEELLARLRALLRRHTDCAEQVPVVGGRLDVSTRTVELDEGEAVVLSPREADLLLTLARSPRRVFSRDELLALVFPDSDDEGVVDTYVHYVRRKLGKDGVKTVRGLGYRLGAAR